MIILKKFSDMNNIMINKSYLRNIVVF